MNKCNMTNKPEPRYCPVCESEMIYVDHWEHDGFDGSHEPYWECPDNCPEPEEPAITLPKLNPRFIASDPWRSIDDALESLIDKVVLELHPDTLDDDINDLLDEWDNRTEAMHYLIKKLLKMGEPQ